MNEWFKELAKRDHALYRFGWLNAALFAFALVMGFVDDTTVMGINAWIKPMKFALSITVYAWTFGWMLAYSLDARAKRIIRWGLIVTMTAEIVLIFVQAARGTTSHFNIHTPLDGAIFGIMGFFIAINTLINFYAVVHFFSSRVSLTGASRLAWQSGLILFFLGSLSGGWMVQQLSHTVGAPDGGPGIPFLNWSTVAGDVRSAHFVTLHGLQVLPLTGFILERYAPGRNLLLWTAIVLYSGLAVYLHVHAYLGLPVIHMP